MLIDLLIFILLFGGAYLDDHYHSHWWALVSMLCMPIMIYEYWKEEQLRKISQRGTKMKFSLDQWVETDINGISIRQVKCADCGTEESADQREYNLDCQCGGSFKSVMLRMTTIKQGQIIDYLIDDDDEEYCIQFNDREILWVAGVALRPIETPAAPKKSVTRVHTEDGISVLSKGDPDLLDAIDKATTGTPHPAEEFLNEG